MQPSRCETLTFLLQVHATFGNDDRHITIYIALSFLIGEGDGNVCVLDALLKWNAEYPDWRRDWID